MSTYCEKCGRAVQYPERHEIACRAIPKFQPPSPEDQDSRAPVKPPLIEPFAFTFTWTHEKTLRDLHREVVDMALEHFQGNRTHTARALGISIRTLRNYINGKTVHVSPLVTKKEFP